MARYCICCGERYGTGHTEACPRYQPPTEIELLKAELAKQKPLVDATLKFAAFFDNWDQPERHVSSAYGLGPAWIKAVKEYRDEKG